MLICDQQMSHQISFMQLHAAGNQQSHHDLSQVLELVVPFLDTREMHVRLSTVSQHMQHVMQTHVRQHIAAYLKQYLGHGAWLPSTGKYSTSFERASEGVCPSLKWLCSFAGAEAMGTAEAATAVLSGGFIAFATNERTARVVAESGLRLTDDSVVAAAAATAQQQHTTVAEHAADLLQATAPERAEQHSGLTPLMRFACTAKHGDPMPPEFHEWAGAMSQQQLYGVLLVMVPKEQHPMQAFPLLLKYLLLKQRCPNPKAPDSGRKPVHLKHMLLQLLRTSMHKGPDSCVAWLVGAVKSRPLEMQPDPSTCVELLTLADSSCSSSIKHLATLPGIQSLPQEVFEGLLYAHTQPPRKRLDNSLAQLLKLPHAQHISGSQLSRLLAHCMDKHLNVFGTGVKALLRLPAVQQMSSNDALEVLKLAATHEGRLLADAGRFRVLYAEPAVQNVADHEKVWGTFEVLTEHLVESDAVELFRHVIHYRWHDFIPTLMACEPLMEQLSPEGLAAVIKDMVTSGLWLHQHNIGNNKQLQDKVLKLELVQQLEEDHVFAMMQALAELGHEMAPVFCKVDSASGISCEQVAVLMKLAVDNGVATDVCNMAMCQSATELQADFVLEMVKRLVDEWPITGRSFWQANCVHLHNRCEALADLLKIRAAEDFSSEDCLALATAAAKAGSLDAFKELCRGLPQLPPACKELPLHLLLRLYRLAVDKGDDDAVEQLTGLSASQQLSTADLQSLLLQAIARATRVSSNLDPSESSSWNKESYQEAVELLKQRDIVIDRLLGAQSDLGAMTPSGVWELLQSCILHGVVSTARALLQESSAQQMNAGQLEQLLLTQLSQHARQYKNAEEVQQLLGLLLQHPAAAELDAAALSRLIVRYGAFTAAATSSKERQRQGTGGKGATQSDEGEDVLDPVELLVGLPAVQQYDAAGLACVLAAAAEARASSRVFELLCCAPAAVKLDTTQLRQLLRAAAQHYNAGAFSRLLQHPAAPGRGDSQVQLYAGMLGC